MKHLGAASQSYSLLQLGIIEEFPFILGWFVCQRENSYLAFATFAQPATIPFQINIRLTQCLANGISLTDSQPDILRQYIKPDIYCFAPFCWDQCAGFLLF